MSCGDVTVTISLPTQQHQNIGTTVLAKYLNAAAVFATHAYLNKLHFNTQVLTINKKEMVRLIKNPASYWIEPQVISKS